MNILFTGIGGPTPLGLAKSVKKAFPDFRCVGVDCSPWAANLYHSDVFDSTHRVVTGNAHNYWNVITRIIEKESIDFAFVVPETEVLVWSKRQNTASLPCQTLLPDFEMASFCFNKLEVAAFLHPLGLAPKTIAFNPQSSVNKCTNLVPYPFWIRVKSGAGALGALKICNNKDLDTWLSLHNYRNDFIISEFLPGRNYACKLLFVEGKLLQHASAERIDYLLAASAPSGISGMCSRGRLLNRQDLVERSVTALKKISNKFKATLNGIFTVDFKGNSDASPLITEINIRHVSFNHAFTLAGVNFAETTLNHFLGNKTLSPNNIFKEEFFFIRGVDAPLRLIPPDSLKSNLDSFPDV